MTWTLNPPAARDANKGLTVSCTNGWSFATFSFINAFTVLDFPTPCLPTNTTVNSLSPVSVCSRCMCSAIVSRVGCGMDCKPIHGFIPGGGVVVAPSEVVACSSSCASSSSSTFSVVGERETERERGVKNVRFLFVEEESTQNAFAARPLFEKRRRQKRKTSTENKMSTPRYTRPRERTFAAIFGFILPVVVVVIEFLSHSRGVGQSFDTDEIFSRFGATLHFVCKTHILEKKKAARFEEKWSRRERGNARTGSKKGVARTSPGDAIICAAFFR